MHIIGHSAVAAIGFCLTKEPLFILGSLLPDIALLPNELKRQPFDKWNVRGKKLYELTHSLFFPIAVWFLSPITAIGILIHILLDIPFHTSSFRWKPFLYNRYKPNKKALLLSGGADSIACFMLEKDYDCFFFSYGQHYCEKEYRCAKRICEQNEIPLTTIHVPWQHDVRNRNYMMVMELAKRGYDEVIIGSRNLFPLFDKYKDSNWFSLKLYQYLLRIYINTPLVGMTKRSVIKACKDNLFYSSENYTSKK